MFQKRQSSLPSKYSLVITLFAMAIAWFPVSVQAAESQICSKGAKSLRGSYNVLQGRGGGGGIWSYMENIASLKEKSFLGLQLDGKLQRPVHLFETMCEEGKTPSLDLFNKIEGLIGEARMLFNISADKTPSKIILAKIKELIKKCDEVIDSIG